MKGNVVADLVWSSFVLHVCLVLRSCSVWSEWFCAQIESLFHTWAWWVQEEEKGVMFSESVFPNGRVLLILLKWVRLWLGVAEILFSSCIGCPVHLICLSQSQRGGTPFINTCSRQWYDFNCDYLEHKQLISKLIRSCDHPSNLWKSWD